MPNDADLGSKLERLTSAVKMLSHKYEELREENAVLLTHLESVGILRGQDFLTQLHRRRFARVLQRHPISWTSKPSLEACASTQELAIAVTSLAGPSCLSHLAAASRSISRGIKSITPSLKEMFPIYVYAVGGVSGGARGPLPVVERFSLDSGSCLPVAPLGAPRAVCAAIAFAGRIYALAGRGGDGAALNTVESFDPRSGTWSPEPALREASGWVAAAGTRHGICVVGGERDERTLRVSELLVPQQRQWFSLPPLSNARWAAGAAAIGGRVFVAGGHCEDKEGATQVLDTFESLVLGGVPCPNCRVPELPLQ